MSTDTHGTVFKNGSATCMARIVGHNAAAITRTDVAAIHYGIWLLAADDPDSRTAVADHADVAIDKISILFDSLQTDARWTRDAVGYNFRHTIDVTAHPAFTLAGRDYLVEYRLTPYIGQMILARFRLHCI
ncbi:MAG TPA: hypothetical protein VJL29_03490 [Thermoguttaceae bacterium]|nr:hypothetical protein [Thermoguttaceae bacterium]